MRPDLIDHINENITEVRNLIKIHTAQTGKKRGRRASEIDVLNKSCVVLLVACWEVFVEDLSILAFDKMLAKATRHNVFPNKVLSDVSTEIKESKNPLEIWNLAGSGWKKIMKIYKKKTLGNLIDGFNTPNSTNVEGLFKKLIGLKQMTASWKWQGMNNMRAKKKLDELIKLRGDIAHKVKASKIIGKSFVLDNIDFVYYVAVKTNNFVLEYIKKRLGLKKEPWPSANYKGIK